ncbi:MAG: ATP-binding protein [Bacteroidales bacterium]|nr:ATP-binding protein [Bacteroidales bacterium]
MIHRIIEQLIKNDFGRGKIIVLMGARQVGKTTLFDSVVSGSSNVLRLNCDNYDDRSDLENKTSTELRQLMGNHEVVIIDEAQRAKNIGLSLKMLADLKLSMQILVTGSSSLTLANEINEPATGRLIEYNLFPLSLAELMQQTSPREEKRLLEQRMIYGLYPEVVTTPDDAKRILVNLANNYLYRDLLEYRGVKKPEVLQKLVRALALQIGSEVSYNELSRTVGVDKATVESYIDLLEKCFVVFRLPAYSSNLHSEIKRGRKIYFYDNGIRNALLSNFAPLELRDDVGMLWENMMVSERIKRNSYSRSYAQMYFWRTQQQQEVDLIEEQDGRLTAFEFKWNTKKKAKLPKTFIDNYPNTDFKVISPDNYVEFVDTTSAML